MAKIVILFQKTGGLFAKKRVDRKTALWKGLYKEETDC